MPCILELSENKAFVSLTDCFSWAKIYLRTSLFKEASMAQQNFSEQLPPKYKSLGLTH